MTTDGWRTVRFGDVVRNVNVTGDAETSGLERYVAGEHMETDDLHIRRWGTIGDSYLGPAFHRQFVSGQVLYGSRRTYLRKIAVADFDGICANTTFTLEPNGDELLPELLPFIMQTASFTEHSVKQSKGSVNPYINWKDLAWYEFALPPRDEQRRIADILWAADEAILKNQHVLEVLAANTGHIFEGLIAKHGSSFRAELGDAITEILAGTSPACSSEPAALDAFGVLKVSAVGEHGYVQEENKALLQPSQFVPDLEVRSGFFLITRANALKSGVGRVCIVKETRPGLMLSDKTLRLVVDDCKVRPFFLLQALRTKECRNYIEAAANGTEAKNISQAKLRKAPIPLPPLTVQEEIELLLGRYDQCTDAARSHLKVLQQLKRQLLKELLKEHR